MTRYLIDKLRSSSSVGTENSDSAESKDIKSESESITCLWLNLNKYLCLSVSKYLLTTSKLRILRIILVMSSSFYNFLLAKYRMRLMSSSRSLSKHDTKRLNVFANLVLYLYLFTISSTTGIKLFSLISFSILFCVMLDSWDKFDLFSSKSEFRSKFLNSFNCSDSVVFLTTFLTSNEDDWSWSVSGGGATNNYLTLRVLVWYCDNIYAWSSLSELPILTMP